MWQNEYLEGAARAASFPPPHAPLAAPSNSADARARKRQNERQCVDGGGGDQTPDRAAAAAAAAVSGACLHVGFGTQLPAGQWGHDGIYDCGGWRATQNREETGRDTPVRQGGQPAAAVGSALVAAQRPTLHRLPANCQFSFH